MAKINVKWDIIQIKCANCGSDMLVTDGPWGCFYSCTTYPQCFNRLNVQVYEKILEHITDLLCQHPDTNFTGYKWEFKTSYQHYIFRIVKHRPDKFIVEVGNMKKVPTLMKKSS